MNDPYSSKIKKIRKERNLSQKQLAKLINVSQQTIASWEVGRTEPKSENFHALSKVLDVPVSFFVDSVAQYQRNSFNEYFEQLSDEDKNRVFDYMKLLKKQEHDRDTFLKQL